MITNKEYICSKCRRTLNLIGAVGLQYCPVCDNIMIEKGAQE